MEMVIARAVCFHVLCKIILCVRGLLRHNLVLVAAGLAVLARIQRHIVALGVLDRFPRRGRAVGIPCKPSRGRKISLCKCGRGEKRERHDERHDRR